MIGDDFPLVLEVCWDCKRDEEVYSLRGNASRRRGNLVFGHEYDLTVDKGLNFRSAWSIDCGECVSYGKESDFEASYPGVMDSVRKAARKGKLLIRRFKWDGKMNTPYTVPYEPE